MFEVLFEILCEFLLQLLGEALFEVGLHALSEPFRRSPNPWLACIGYILFGTIVGGISVLVVPTHGVHVRAWRLANLVITPVAVGLCMSALGAWRAKRDQSVLRIDRFGYGYLFALSFALIRVSFTT